MAELVLKDTQQCLLSISEEDARGNPVEVKPDELTWLSSDETVATVTDNGDGTALVVAAGALGLAQVQVQDSETDGTNIAGTLDVQVGPGPVTKVNITPGTPTEQGA